MTTQRLAAVCLVLLWALAGAAAEVTFTLKERLGRDWGPELVRHSVAVPPGAKVAEAPLVRVDGTVVPAQMAGATEGKGGTKAELFLVLSLAKGQAMTVSIDPTQSSRLPELPHRQRRGYEEAGNDLYNLRVARTGKVEFREPKAASEVPTPIQAWRSAKGDWTGASAFVSSRKVRGYVGTLREAGPALLEYEYRYSFVPKGEYVCTIRIVAGIPVAFITDEFDLGDVTEGGDDIVYFLDPGWTPTHVAWETQSQFQGAAANWADYAAKKRTEVRKPMGSVPGNEPPDIPPPVAGWRLLEKISAWGRWGGFQSWCALGALDAAKQIAAFAGLTPLHTGSWRRATALYVWDAGERGVAVAMPIGARRTRWYKDIVDDQSPFSTHEHDETLPRTYGRREVALAPAAVDLGEVRLRPGFIGLRRYKDWQFDWKKPEPKEFPRAILTRSAIPALKAAMDRNPYKGTLEKLYVFSGRKEDAVESANRFLRTGIHMGESSPYTTGYRQSDDLGSVIVWADDALACPELPAELRDRVFDHLVAMAYQLADPDFNPRGSGVHCGNNNMTINRTLALAIVGCLLKGHPEEQYWLGTVKRFLEFKLASQTASDGAWIAPPVYQMYGPTRNINVAGVCLRNSGWGNVFETGSHEATLLYLSRLITPVDPRTKSRMFAGMGNSSNTSEQILGLSMEALRGLDEPFRGTLSALHDELSGGAPIRPGYGILYDPTVPKAKPDLTTAFHPAYGVMFRAHWGTPDETMLLFRCGYNWSHWDTDNGNLVLYSKGAPLLPGTAYQYFSTPVTQEFAIHNRLRFGARGTEMPFGRVDSYVQEYGSTDSADYASGVSFYPAQLFGQGAGDVRWQRQVLFLRSPKPDGPNYFVLRDSQSTSTPQRSFAHFLNCGEKEMVAVAGRQAELKTDFGASTWLWFAEPAALKHTFGRIEYPWAGLHPRGRPKTETKSILQIENEPGKPFFYVLYPRKDAEPAPQVEVLSPAVLKVTHREGTDFVLLADAPAKFTQGDLTLAGKAAVVRLAGKAARLVLGPGEGRVGYKDYVVDGCGPFEEAVPLARLKPGLKQSARAALALRPVEADGVRLSLKEGVGRVEKNGLFVEGEGPFEVVFARDRVVGFVNGVQRSLVMTFPEGFDRPQLFIDGKEHMACWTDYPGSSWGRMNQIRVMALSLPAGPHAFEVRDLTFPPVWKKDFEPKLGNPSKGESK